LPNLRNRAPFPAALTPLIDRHGRNVVVVIAKATYVIPFAPDDQWLLAGVQEPILMVDQYVGAPGASDVRVPADLTDFKPATEVLIVRPESEPDERALRGRTIQMEIGSVRLAKGVTDKWPFGPLRRDEEPRKTCAGTYDETWVRERMPLLPEDFDPRYNLSAPSDQIADTFLAGDESFRLANLYEDGRTVSGRLPGQSVAVSGNVLHKYFTDVATLDTVLVWSSQPKLTLVWRYCISPKSKVEEVRNVYVDPVRVTTARELYGKP
jgi:hypothetical protein